MWMYVQELFLGRRDPSVRGRGQSVGGCGGYPQPFHPGPHHAESLARGLFVTFVSSDPRGLSKWTALQHPGPQPRGSQGIPGAPAPQVLPSGGCGEAGYLAATCSNPNITINAQAQPQAGPERLMLGGAWCVCMEAGDSGALRKLRILSPGLSQHRAGSLIQSACYPICQGKSRTLQPGFQHWDSGGGFLSLPLALRDPHLSSLIMDPPTSNPGCQFSGL